MTIDDADDYPIQIKFHKTEIDHIATQYGLELKDEDYDYIAHHFRKSMDSIMNDCWELLESTVNDCASNQTI